MAAISTIFHHHRGVGPLKNDPILLGRLIWSLFQILYTDPGWCNNSRGEGAGGGGGGGGGGGDTRDRRMTAAGH